MASPSPTAAKSKPFKWGFGTGLLVLLTGTVLAEILIWLVYGTLQAQGGAKMGYAVGLFACLLPIFGIVAFRPRLVFEFFRSVKVGVMNLFLIGLASIFGVLFQQEKVDRPIPKGAIESLADWVEFGETRPWTEVEQTAYDYYAGGPRSNTSFRNAQAFFVYRFFENLGLDGIFELDPSLEIDFDQIETKLARVDQKIPQLEARFGVDFGVALAAQSRTGLITRERNLRIQAVEEKFDDLWWSMFRWANRLDLLRVYKSPWFAFYWYVLFIGVLVNSFRGGWRRNLKPGRWPFLTTHAGILLICFGGQYSRFTEQRGILNLNIGRESGKWLPWKNFESNQTLQFDKGEVPFKVRLDGFRADHHDVMSINYVVQKPDGRLDFEFPLDRQPEERIWQGRVLKYDYLRDSDGGLGKPQLRIEVKKMISQSKQSRDLHIAEPGEFSASMARLALLDLQGNFLREPTPLAAAIDLSLVHGDSASRVKLIEVADIEAAQQALLEPIPARLGYLHREGASRDQQFHDVTQGLSFEDQTDLGAYKIEVLQALPILRLLEASEDGIVAAPLERELEYLEPSNPAVKLRITSASGETEERWVLQADQSHSLPAKFADLRYGFTWDTWAAPAHYRYLLMQSPEGLLWWGQVGQPETLQVVTPGQIMKLGGQQDLKIVQALPNASTQLRYSALEGVDFFDPAPAAALMEITYPDEHGHMQTIEKWMRTKDGRGRLDLQYPANDGNGMRQVVLFFNEQASGLPIEWRSKLQIKEPDPISGSYEEVHSGVILVNDYLTYRGYRFFQTNYDPRDPTYSGIGVVYDPGIDFVLLGFYMVMFGTIIVFLIKPIFTRKHRAA
jgi:hypothetical protein